MTSILSKKNLDRKRTKIHQNPPGCSVWVNKILQQNSRQHSFKISITEDRDCDLFKKVRDNGYGLLGNQSRKDDDIE